ncbi:DUF4180 domain-containing protein [Hymenobacter sp. B81]|uniref:DUF4180 domain-containing protein n=1 Tax=Hymenobacter sp. B81 TaxID=3344878 RepID=UPI0037DDAB15
MEISAHEINDLKIAEVVSDEVVIQTAADGLDLLGNVYYQGFDGLLLHQHQLTPDFFALRTGVAGEILQKFSNYRVRLAIVGDFSYYTSQSLRDFMAESNQGRQVSFVSTREEALQRLARQ